MHEIDEQTTILEMLIIQEPDGLLISEIDARTGLDLDRRTLQRRLRELIKDGRVETHGKGRALRYAPTVKD
jgi:predicted transcriptional regulator